MAPGSSAGRCPSPPRRPRRYLGFSAASGGRPAPAPRGPTAAAAGSRRTRSSTERLRVQTRLENTRRGRVDPGAAEHREARPACPPRAGKPPEGPSPGASAAVRETGVGRERAQRRGRGRAAGCAGGNRAPARLEASAAAAPPSPRVLPLLPRARSAFPGAWPAADVRGAPARTRAVWSASRLLACLQTSGFYLGSYHAFGRSENETTCASLPAPQGGPARRQDVAGGGTDSTSRRRDAQNALALHKPCGGLME